MTSLLGGGVVGLLSKPKVTTSTVGHFFGQKVTKSDGGREGLAYLVNLLIKTVTCQTIVPPPITFGHFLA